MPARQRTSARKGAHLCPGAGAGLPATTGRKAGKRAAATPKRGKRQGRGEVLSTKMEKSLFFDKKLPFFFGDLRNSPFLCISKNDKRLPINKNKRMKTNFRTNLIRLAKTLAVAVALFLGGVALYYQADSTYRDIKQAVWDAWTEPGE